MATLYSLTTEFQSLLDAISEGEIPEEAIADTIEGLQGEIDDKIDHVLDAFKTLIAEAEAIKAEEKRLSERRHRKEAASEKIKAYLHDELLKLGKARHESARHSVSFRRSSRVVVTNNEEFIKWALDNNRDDLYHIKVSREPNKDALSKESGEIPYVQIVTNQNIQIK